MMSDWEELEAMLLHYRDVTQSIRLFLFSYEKEIISVSKEIANLDFEDADIFFNRLYEIQNYLATILYKYEFPLSEKLRAFVYHFERDDLCSREFWYQKFLKDAEWFSEIN